MFMYIVEIWKEALKGAKDYRERQKDKDRDERKLDKESQCPDVELEACLQKHDYRKAYLFPTPFPTKRKHAAKTNYREHHAGFSVEIYATCENCPDSLSNTSEHFLHVTNDGCRKMI